MSAHTGNVDLLARTLAKAKSQNRAALVAYLPAGFPTVDGGIAAVKAVVAGGA
ncbi:tryptophan synthase subunit alpha, partial [Streptomyces sp. NPDC098789]